MDAEHVVALAGVAFFLAAGARMVRSVARGRALVRLFEARLPEEYSSAGRPFPGYFDSQRRTRYFAFVMRREYLSLSDPLLIAQIERHRRSEVRFFSFLLASFALFGLAFVGLHWGQAG
jgi:hypothetical protein